MIIFIILIIVKNCDYTHVSSLRIIKGVHALDTMNNLVLIIKF